jgi:hypothetical protein
MSSQRQSVHRTVLLPFQAGSPLLLRSIDSANPWSRLLSVRTARRVTEWLCSLRPGLKGGSDDPEKFLTTRPGRRLNGQPKVHRLHKTRKRVAITGAGKIAFGNCTLEPCAQIGVALRSLLNEFIVKRIRRPPARKRTVNPEASSWQFRIGDQIDDPVQQVFNDRARGRLFQRVLKIGSRALKVALDSPPKQSLLVAKGRVETRAINSHRLR